jgi:hypothetical protein
MIQDKIFFDEKDPTGVSYNTPFTVYGSYEGRLWSKTPSGTIKYYTQNSDLSVYATTGSNQFSGSQSVTGSLIVTEGITGTATTASYVEYASVANKPTLVSGSEQVSFNGIVDKPTLVSGSSQIIYSEISSIPEGIVSSSAQVGGYGIFATTGSNSFNGSQTVTGSLTVTGQVVAQTLNVQQVTSSIVYSSGSNVFGNSLSNTQQFTGSVSVTGSLAVNGTSAVTGTGTTNYLPKFTGTSTIGNSLLTDNGTNIGLGIANPTAGRLQINVSDTTTAAHFQVVDGTTTLANSFVTNFRNANDGNGRYSLSSWQAQNASGNDQIGFIGVQSVTGASNYTPNLIFGQKTGISSFATRMILDASGNLGLGVTPSAYTVGKVIEVGTLGNSFWGLGINSVQLSSNYYFDGAYRYANNGFANRYDIGSSGGQHIWFTAPSGTAGNAISFTQAMTLSAAGRLLIGKTNDEEFTLDVNGTGRFSGSLLVSNSTDTYPEFRTSPIDADVFLGFTNTGDGNNAWGVGRRNTGEFWITNFTGNFNSGTRTTVLALASTGAATFSSSVTAGGTATNYGTLQIMGSATSASLTVGTAANTILAFSPGQELAITGNNAAPYGISFQGRNSLAGGGSSGTSYPILLNPLGGNVGIGTTTDNGGGQKLQVNGSVLINAFDAGNETGIFFRSGAASSFKYNLSILAYDHDSGGSADGISINGFDGVSICTGANTRQERMRITSGGYLKVSSDGTYVGATSPFHEITATSNDSDLLLIRHKGTAPYGLEISFSGATPNNGTNWFQYFQDATAARFIVRSNGGLQNYQANDGNLSDERVKKGIAPLESYWDKFKAIEIVKFKYKDQTHDDYNIGVIAQQVESVAPEFVDVDGWGETVDGEEPLKSIYTADLHHATIKVLQEAMAKIESLEAILQRNNIS